jgi:hypothetical protein
MVPIPKVHKSIACAIVCTETISAIETECHTIGDAVEFDDTIGITDENTIRILDEALVDVRYCRRL